MAYKNYQIKGIVVWTDNGIRTELKFNSLTTLIAPQIINHVVEFVSTDATVKNTVIRLPIELILEDESTVPFTSTSVEPRLREANIKFIIESEEETMNNTTTANTTTDEATVGMFESAWQATVEAVMKHAPAKDIKAIIETPDFMVYDIIMGKVDGVIEKLCSKVKFKEANDLDVAQSTIKSIVAEAKENDFWETLKAVAALILRKVLATAKGITRFTLDTTIILSTMVVRIAATCGLEVYHAGRAIGKSAVKQYTNIKNA